MESGARLEIRMVKRSREGYLQLLQVLVDEQAAAVAGNEVLVATPSDASMTSANGVKRVQHVRPSLHRQLGFL